MAVFNFPDICPSSEEWTLTFNTQSFVSDLNGAAQTAELPGAQWSVNARFTNKGGRDARELKAFFVSLRGRAGRFKYTPADWRPLGTAQGSPKLSVAAFSGTSAIETNGWTASQAEALIPGDYFSLNGELKQVTQPVSVNAAGIATVNFSPPLRISISADAQLVTYRPFCTMKLAKDDTAKWSISAPFIYNLTLNASEALDI